MDDRRVVSGIIYVIRHGLQRKYAPPGYGPHKTLYNRFIRRSRLGVFARIFGPSRASGRAGAAAPIKGKRCGADLLACARVLGLSFVTSRLGVAHATPAIGREGDD